MGYTANYIDVILVLVTLGVAVGYLAIKGDITKW